MSNQTHAVVRQEVRPRRSKAAERTHIAQPGNAPARLGLVHAGQGGIGSPRGPLRHREPAVTPPPNDHVPPGVHDALRSPGQPIDAATRIALEHRFGHDFSCVRIHTDDRAARSARSMHALAYTWGQDIVFGRGKYQPGRPEGLRILAHELAHVVQQAPLQEGRPDRVAPARDVRELAADSAARIAMTGGRVRVAPAGPARLSLLRDSRLEALLATFPAAIHGAPGPMNDQQAVDLIVSHFAGVNLRDADNLGPVADAVARNMSETALFAFLRRVQADVGLAQVAPQEEQMQRTLHMLQVQPTGPYRTVTPFPVSEIVAGTIAHMVGRVNTVVQAFFEGMIDGMGGPGSDALIAQLQKRLLEAAVLNVVAGPVFTSGALVGIARDFWQGIKGLWDLITNFSGMMGKFGELFDALFSPAGAALSRLMGRQIGQDFRAQLMQLPSYDVFRFTYELGKMIGPTIVYAVLFVLDLTQPEFIPATVAAVSTRLGALLKQIPVLMRIIEGIGSFVRGSKVTAALVRIAEVTEREMQALQKLAGILRRGGKWTEMTAAERTLLGGTFHKIVESVVAKTFPGSVFKNEEITAELLQRLQGTQRRVLFVEGKLRIGGSVKRVDLAEVNFATRRVSVIDLTSIERADHVAKTAGYGQALQRATGFPGEAVEMRYVGDDAALLETLTEAAIHPPGTAGR